jgi:AcrR family transcriptional regulator
MSVRDERRRAVLAQTADHLLEQGLAGASLRPMAAAAGTSDRMLLYYFADRDELLAATLEEVAARMTAMLAAAGGSEPRPYPVLLREVWAAFRAPAFQRYLSLWLEVAAGAARGQEPYRGVGGAIADGFLAWAGERLLVEREEERAPQAALLLATIDGLALLDAVGRGAAAEAALSGS